MSVLAIDPSLSRTGWAFNGGKKLQMGSIVPPKSHNRGLARLSYILQEVDKLLMWQPTLVVYEGYAMGIAGGGRAFDLGELGGVLKLHLYRNRIPFLLVPPTSLKMFVTGKGNAKKDEVELVCMRRRRERFANQDESDAYGLLWMGEAYENPLLIQESSRDYQRRAYQGCELFEGKSIVL